MGVGGGGGTNLDWGILNREINEQKNISRMADIAEGGGMYSLLNLHYIGKARNAQCVQYRYKV